MAVYDKYYTEENYFGNPYPELIALFKEFDKDKTVLDLGCGQGRDALALGKLGFSVVGVDLSEVGINQMNKRAKELGVDVKGIVGSYTDYRDIVKHDIILMDSMFHFYKNDVEVESKLLSTLLRKMKSGALIVMFIQYDKARIKVFHQAIKNSRTPVDILQDTKFLYQEFKSEFNMTMLQKK